MSKILLLATHFPPTVGGTPTVYFNICQNMDPKEIVVLTKKSGNWEEFDQAQQFKIYRMDQISHLDFHIFQEIRDILHIIKTEKIDTIIFGHINFCLTALLLRFLFRKKYFFYIHGEEITRHYGGKYYQFFKWKSLENAEGIIAVSDYTKTLIEQHNSNIKVIYNAVDAKKFTPKAKNTELIKRHNLENKTVLLTVARLENRKGQDMVIRCLQEIVKETPNLKYLIVGEGKEKVRLKNLVAKERLEEYVEFLGTISPELLVDYYNLCDIFVMPNRETEDGNTEGFGISFLEANACGKPVIGGKAGGVLSVIKDGYNGFLVDGKSRDEILNAISKLIKNESLRVSIGQNGTRWAKEFTYDKLVKEIKAFLD